MNKFRLVMTIVCTAWFFGLSCALNTSGPPPATVKDVDLSRYTGTWYEIARLPNTFEKGLECVTATYTLETGGSISVLNSGRKESDRTRIKSARGKALVPDPSEPGRLEVTFFWPFSGKYWILDLDRTDYRYALVGNPARKYLWVLSRTRTMPETVYLGLIRSAREMGFDTDRLIRVNQDCE